MLYAMIDIGSNTVRMAIYQIKDGEAELLMKKKHLVGLAAYVQEGIMLQTGIDRAVEILSGFKAFLAQFGIDNMVAFTTAALRNATNSREAVGEIERRTGIPIRIILGEEEAEYDFLGAIHGLAASDGLIVDIGGGSTELVAYEDRTIAKKTSLPMGSLAFRTKYVKGLLPTSEDVETMRAAAREHLKAEKDFAGLTYPELVGIGGTFKGAAALYRDVYGAEGPMEVEKLDELIDRFEFTGKITENMTISLLRAVPERMHTILPGLVIASEVAAFFGAKQITYSDSGVREGYLYAEVLKEAK